MGKVHKEYSVVIDTLSLSIREVSAQVRSGLRAPPLGGSAAHGRFMPERLNPVLLIDAHSDRFGDLNTINRC